MAEVEYQGFKLKGGKIFILFSLLGTLGGGLWGAFEFWKDYQDMKSKILTYTAPDLSHYDTQLEVLKSEISTVLEEVSLVNDVASNLSKNINDDLKDLERELSQDLKVIEQDLEDKIQKILANPLAGVK